MTHKNDGFIENLMKVPAPLKTLPLNMMCVSTLKVFNSMSHL